MATLSPLNLKSGLVARALYALATLQQERCGLTMFFKTRFKKEKTSVLSDTEAFSRIAGLGSFAIAGSISETATWQKGGG
jgi:hypothetical protein